MRLLPNQIRVVVKERTPIAFVRLGSDIELADANGVVLSMSPGAMTTHHYHSRWLRGSTRAILWLRDAPSSGELGETPGFTLRLRRRRK